MLQVLWRIPITTQSFPDGIPIYGFGVMLFLAFIVCTWMGGRRGERQGISKETIQDLAIWIFVGGLLGARITYLLQEPNVGGLWGMLKRLPQIWEGGIVLYGAVLGAVASYAVAWLLIYRKRGLSTLRFVDVVAPTVAVGLCLGRLGCFLNGCCFGQVACADCAVIPAHFPLSSPPRVALVDAGYQTVAGFTVAIPQPPGLNNGVSVGAVDPSSRAYEKGLRPGSVIVGVNDHDVQRVADLNRYLAGLEAWPRGQAQLTLTFQPTPGAEPVSSELRPRTLGLYPTQIYEVISMLLLLLVLLSYDSLRRQPGQVGAVLMVGYGVHRFLNEILRDDPRPVDFEQIGSIALVAGGLFLWLWLQFKPVPATASSAASPGPAPA
jgi:prolipoprotein diacylglyceryltransferase